MQVLWLQKELATSCLSFDVRKTEGLLHYLEIVPELLPIKSIPEPVFKVTFVVLLDQPFYKLLLELYAQSLSAREAAVCINAVFELIQAFGRG